MAGGRAKREAAACMDCLLHGFCLLQASALHFGVTSNSLQSPFRPPSPKQVGSIVPGCSQHVRVPFERTPKGQGEVRGTGGKAVASSWFGCAQRPLRLDRLRGRDSQAAWT